MVDGRERGVRSTTDSDAQAAGFSPTTTPTGNEGQTLKAQAARTMQTKAAVEIEAGPVKIKGIDSPITYVIIFAIIGVMILYIYAKYLHQPVTRVARRIIRRKKK
jgi:hypothetical protein